MRIFPRVSGFKIKSDKVFVFELLKALERFPQTPQRSVKRPPYWAVVGGQEPAFCGKRSSAFRSSKTKTLSDLILNPLTLGKIYMRHFGRQVGLGASLN